jgi:hypothetical protein
MLLFAGPDLPDRNVFGVIQANQISINELVSLSRHHIEFGVGTAFTNEEMQGLTGEKQERLEHFFNRTHWTQHQKSNGRFIFRIGFTPLYELDGNEIHPSGGLSFG